jgi:SH3 domain-containing YSC84-like protein 1
MKWVIATLLLLGFAGTTLAVNQAELDHRIQMLTSKFEIMEAKPEKRIPPKLLSQAQGIVLLDRFKAGFLFAYEGGAGIAMARNPHTGGWSAPLFVSANQASLGFQAGGKESFVVILLMDKDAVHGLAANNFSFGGEASGTAGNATGGADGTVSSNQPSILVYSDASGLYGGVAVKGGNISPDTKAGIAYYGEYVSPEQILFEQKVKPSIAASRLAQVIQTDSK